MPSQTFSFYTRSQGKKRRKRKKNTQTFKNRWSKKKIMSSSLSIGGDKGLIIMKNKFLIENQNINKYDLYLHFAPINDILPKFTFDNFCLLALVYFAPCKSLRQQQGVFFHYRHWPNQTKWALFNLSHITKDLSFCIKLHNASIINDELQKFKYHEYMNLIYTLNMYSVFHE